MTSGRGDGRTVFQAAEQQVLRPCGGGEPAKFWEMKPDQSDQSKREVEGGDSERSRGGW